MAVNATFLADFSTFLDAVNKADVALADFGKGAEKVEDQLNKMVDRFSGRKVIQEAIELSLAVERIGGVSKLTANELQAVGAKAAEAVEKMQKLGYGTAPGLQALADAAAAAAKGQGDLSSATDASVASMAKGVAGGQLFVDILEGITEWALKAAKAVGVELVEATKKGAELGDVEAAFNRLTASAGLLSDALLGTLRTATGGFITDLGLMKNANAAMAADLNLSLSAWETLGKGATALGKATGTDAATGLQTLTDAMITGNEKAVRAVVSQDDLTAARKRFADQLGGDYDKLTAEAQLWVRRSSMLDAVKSATDRLGDAQGGLVDRVQQSNVAWSNFEAQLGKSIDSSPVLISLFDSVKKSLVDAFGGSQQTLIAGVTHLIEQGAIQLTHLGDVGVTIGSALATEWQATKVVFGDALQAVDLLRLAFLGLEKIKLAPGAWLHPDSTIAREYAAINEEINKLNATVQARGKSLQDAKAAEEAIAATEERLHGVIQSARDAMEKAAASSDSLVGARARLTVATNESRDSVERHGVALAEDTKAQEARTKALLTAWEDLTTVGANYEATLAAMNQDTRTLVEALLAQGASMKSLEVTFGLTTSQAKAFNDQQKEINDTLRIQEKVGKDTEKIWLDYFAAVEAQGATPFEKATIAANKWADNMRLTVSGLKGDFAAFYDAIDARRKQMIDQSLVDERTLAAGRRGLLDEQYAKAKATYEAMRDASTEYTDEAIEHARQEMDKLGQLLGGMAPKLGEPFKKGKADIDATTESVKTLAGQLNALVSDPKVPQYFGSLLSGQASVARTIAAGGTSPGEAAWRAAGGVPSLPIGGGGSVTFRAGGGPVDAGAPYIVGERGPELFVPDTMGNIWPGGGGINVTVNVNGNVLGTPNDVARAVGGAMMSLLRSQGTRLPTGSYGTGPS